jgi:subtilisin family serine protease
MKKFIYIISALIISLALVSCGSNTTTSFSSPGATVTVSRAAPPKVTVQSVLAAAEKGRYREGELLVKFKPGIAGKTAASLHQTMGAAVENRFAVVPNLERVKLAAGMSVKDAIVRYMQDPNVEYAEPNYIGKVNATVPNDTYFNPQQWALRNTGTFASGTEGADIKMPETWDVIKGNSGFVVAVVDSGVDYHHPDLVNNVWTNTGETSCVDGTDNEANGFIDDCRGWNFVDDNDDPMDDLGHGTHVSGIIGAMGNNGMGISGVMWNVKIMPVKACDSTTLFNAVSAADSAGVLLTASAGNGSLDSLGDNDDLSPVYPAAFNLPNIIAVAATDQNDRRATFSNFGPTSVHVAAPGVYVLSTIPSTGIAMSFSSFCTNSFVAGYDFCAGTSMAAPHDAGLAGLLESYYGHFTPSQIRGTILRYVDVLPTLQGWIQTGGRINAYRALTSLLPPSGLSATAPSSSRITLSWTDNATGEDGYRVERKTGTGAFAQIAELPANAGSYTDSGLSASTSYTYRVRAFNSIPADSLYSSEATATTSAGGSGATTGGGGGGGCSVGGRVNGPSAVADTFVMLAPFFMVIAMRTLRRRKK